MPTTYRATAVRSGRWWAVELHDLPPNHIGYTQGRDLADAEYMAQDAVAALLNVPKSEVVIDLHVAEADDVVAEVKQARIARKEAAEKEQSTLVRAARTLVAQGLTRRDAGHVLGISFQRVHQLLNPKPATPRSGSRATGGLAVPK